MSPAAGGKLGAAASLLLLLVVSPLCAASPPRANASTSAPSAPHIVFIIADDLGYNDVGYHGSPQIPTPHIDALAARGVRLESYYVQPVCSPSRSSFLSGRHVIHTGVYTPFTAATAQRLDTRYTLLPRYLQLCCNYSTHLIGKWHAGVSRPACVACACACACH